MVDLAIIGSGVMGTFHALHAALKGKTVIVFEKDLMPMEASVRNFGQVVPSGFPPGRWHHYGRYSTKLYKEIQDKFDIGIRSNGSVYIASTTSELLLLEELHSRFLEVNYDSELLSKNEVLKRWPNLNQEYVVGGLFFSQEVSSESRKMIHQLHAFMKQNLKVEFRCMTPVIAIEDQSDFVEIVYNSTQKLSALKAIVCNGRDFKMLYPEIFNTSDIEVVKLSMMATKPLPSVHLPGNILTGLTIRRYESFKELPSFSALDPNEINQKAIENGIHILFKQRVDGSIVIGDSHHYADINNADSLGFDVDLSVNDIILEEAKKIIQLPSWDIATTWNGFYAQMKGKGDLFEHQPSKNVYIATAIGGKGMTASAGYAMENINLMFAEN